MVASRGVHAIYFAELSKWAPEVRVERGWQCANAFDLVVFVDGARGRVVVA
jgi:hypothetical protein